MEPILRVENVSKSFGGIQAVHNCSLNVRAGTITGLIGPNGAGKTTLFNLITGFHELDSGRIFFREEDITELEPHEIFHRRLYRTFQIFRELRDLTVLENLLIMPTGQVGEDIWKLWFQGRFVQQQEEENLERALEVLEFLEMEEKKNVPVQQLPGGEKKLLDFGRMMMANPEMVLLDEPGAGVPPALQRKVNEFIRRLCDEQDITFFIVEHDMNVIMDLCDPVIVMTEGSILTEGPPEEIQKDDRVAEAYLGTRGLETIQASESR